MNWELMFNLITALLVMIFTWWIYHSDGFPDGRMVEEKVGLHTDLQNLHLPSPRQPGYDGGWKCLVSDRIKNLF